MECLITQLMRLVWAVSICFRFFTKLTTHYRSSPIDTLNLSAENGGKRTENASILQHFLGGMPPDRPSGIG